MVSLLVGFGLLVLVGVVVLTAALAILVRVSDTDAFRWPADERVYRKPGDTKKALPLPTLDDEPTLDLTVIVPAYNEEERIGKMLDETIEFLDSYKYKGRALTHEILVTSDGSRDGTRDVVDDYSRRYGVDRVRLLDLVVNVGKGGAVRRGMMCGRGRYLLMADADGATKASDIGRVYEATRAIESDSGLAVGIGSRAHQAASDAVTQRKWYRNLAMVVFHIVVFVIGGVWTINDTQCGFKLFSREAARKLFPNQHLERWAFDVELLYIAEVLQIPMVEVQVNWSEIEGSKLSVIRASIQMAKDMCLMRTLYTLGWWRIDTSRDCSTSLGES